MKSLGTELLSPVASIESLDGVINAGCNAIYLGGKNFSARAYANNFDEATLLKTIEKAHIKDVKVYLAINTLIKEDQLNSKLYDFLSKPYQEGLDAVIMQDIGAINFVNNNFPDLAIHLSTQSTMILGQGVNVLNHLNITRLVTAREISIDEIKRIKSKSNIEIETFVHGALCYSYSGQCLMSSMIGGRSGNRGRCAQPCRKEYDFYSDKELINKNMDRFILSPKDICTALYIPHMIDAGIDSFKIEGRMKSPYYAALITSFYRKYLDLYYEIGERKFKETINLNNKQYLKDISLLQDIYNRGGFSNGYLFNYSSKEMMSMDRPNHFGVEIGHVTENKNGILKILLSKDINSQDILEVRGIDDKYEFTVKSEKNKSNIISTKFFIKQGKTNFKKGDKVYRTRNNFLINKINEDIILKEKKIEISGELYAHIARPLKLKVLSKTHDIEVIIEGENVSKAEKLNTSEASIIKQLRKTGNTNYVFSKVKTDLGDNIFISIKEINEIRRKAIDILEEKIIKKHYRCLDSSNFIYNKQAKTFCKNEIKNKLKISVLVQNIEQLYVVATNKYVNNIILDLDFIDFPDIKEGLELVGNKKIYLALPVIIREKTYDRLIKEKENILDEKINGYMIRNYEALGLLNEIKACKEIVLDYNMHIFNNEAIKFWQGIDQFNFTSSLELNSKELKKLDLTCFYMLVYGYTKVMVSTQCIYKNTIGCMKHNNKKNILKDEKGIDFYFKLNCNNCYNIIYNSKILSLIKYSKEIIDMNLQGIRLDFTFEDKKEVQLVLDEYIDSFIYSKDVNSKIKNITNGHYKRGVL